jgi:hypothetical protein
MKKTLLNGITLAAFLALAPFQSNAQGIIVVNTKKTQERQRIEKSGPTCSSMKDAVVEARRPIGSSGGAITNYNDAVYAIQVLGRNNYMKTQTPGMYTRSNAEVYGLLQSSQNSIKAGLRYFQEDIIKMLKNEEQPKSQNPSYLESIFSQPLFVSTNLPVILRGYEKLLDSLNAEREMCKGLERKAQEQILKFNSQGDESKYKKDKVTSEENDIYWFLKEACPQRVKELDKEIDSVEKTINKLRTKETKQNAKRICTEYNESISNAKTLRQKQEVRDK